MTKGEKPLLIVGFVNNNVPQDEKETSGNKGNAKIVVTLGSKKRKLETISIQQWVIANIHIFHTLLSEGKLTSQVAIQDHLAYSVKIMELLSRYEWKSILLYNNEFHKLQAVYGFLWRFDSTHLHTVMLQPISKANSFANITKSQPHLPLRATLANFTSDSRIICRNFNWQKACALHNCNFVHTCNGKVSEKACGLPHPG